MRLLFFLAPLVGLFLSTAHSSIAIKQIRYDHCVLDQCISFRSAKGSSSLDGSHYLILNPEFLLHKVDLDFLTDSRAKKVIVDFEHNIARIYSLNYQGALFDVAIDLNSFAVTRFIRR